MIKKIMKSKLNDNKILILNFIFMPLKKKKNFKYINQLQIIVELLKNLRNFRTKIQLLS